MDAVNLQMVQVQTD